MTTTELEKYHKEVKRVFLKLGKPLPKEKEKSLQENMYKTSYKLYNVDEKKLKAAVKSEFSFSKFDDRKKAKIWSYIFKNTEYLDIGQISLEK